MLASGSRTSLLIAVLNTLAMAAPMIKIKSDIEKIERGATDRTDNFFSETLSRVGFIVQMNNLSSGDNRKGKVSFA